jgi:hypothetical protein
LQLDVRTSLISCANEREIDWQSKLGMRVLVACEPRYYREVIGEAIQGLRPAVEVVIVDPEELLADGVSHLDPDLVISAHPPSIDPGGRSAWVEFVPYEKPAATVSIGGRRQELEEVVLEDLLWVVDQAAELSRTRKDLRNH